MSNLSDLRDALEGIGGKNGLGVDSFGAVAGIFGDVSGILDIFAILGLLSKNDDVQKTLSEIQNSLKAGFARLGENEKAQRIIDRESRLNAAYSLSDSVLGTLQADLEANLDWAARSERIEKCIQAIDQLDFDAQWMTIADDELYYEDWWQGKFLQPPRGTTLVFTDRYTLPKYMHAVYAFLLVIRSFDPAYKEHNLSELRKYEQRLVDVHDLSAGGIKLVGIPSFEEATCQWEGLDGGGTISLVFMLQDSTYREATPWGGAILDPANGGPQRPPVDTFQPFGAVHIYTGCSAVGEFPPVPNLGRNMHPPPDYSRLYARLQPKIVVAAHSHRKALYKKLGLPSLRDFINGLRQILGDPELGPDPGRWWTLREVAYLLDEMGQIEVVDASQGYPLGREPPPDLDPRWWENYKLKGAVSARDVVGRLIELSHLPTEPPTNVALSFRNAIDRSALGSPIDNPLKWW